MGGRQTRSRADDRLVDDRLGADVEDIKRGPHDDGWHRERPEQQRGNHALAAKPAAIEPIGGKRSERHADGGRNQRQLQAHDQALREFTPRPGVDEPPQGEPVGRKADNALVEKADRHHRHHGRENDCVGNHDQRRQNGL